MAKVGSSPPGLNFLFFRYVISRSHPFVHHPHISHSFRVPAATSKGSTLYNSGSYVVAAAAAPDGHSVATAHLDGSVFAFAFGDDGNISSPVRICQHPSVPACLAWGEHIAVASPDRKLFFYDPANGSVVQRFDYSRDDDATAAASIAMSPNGASLVVGSVDRVQVYNYQSRRQTWDETPAKAFEGLHTGRGSPWVA